MLIGTGLREKGGTALLYESKELMQWHYLGPLTTASIGTDSNMWECPVLLRFGDFSVLLVCPHPEARHVYWIAGQWRAGNLSELRRGKLDLGTYVYAAQALLSRAEPTICSLTLRASPDHEELTTIAYDSSKQTLTVDCTRSSLDSTVDHPVIAGFLAPDKQGRVRFRAFLDRSVLEVFLGERQCITQRLYPTRNGCQKLRFKVTSGTALVDRMSVWRLDAVWPTVKGDGLAE